MESKYKRVFDVAVSRSNDELLDLVTNMTRKKRQPTFATVPLVVMALVCAVTGALLFYEPSGSVRGGAYGASQTELPGGYDPIPDGLYQFERGETPQVGRFMHHSGDAGQYVEFFSDGTMQIVGFDYLEYYKSIFPTDHDYDDEYVEFCFAQAAAECESIAQRTPFRVENGRAHFGVTVSERDNVTTELGFPLHFADKDTLFLFYGSNVYRFAG
jgi:hypothetical protein